ncbi:MAG TPA: oxygenase MpaB family protein [Acidimicrobiales bacterium]|nr:oxygenase MpaB family protein [Acidimicrobiales bacterium]
MSVTEWVIEAPERLRSEMNRRIRDAAGLAHSEPEVCDDPDEAYTPVDAVARLIHGDLPAMMIGGLASLFFEMLHPLTMAGVDQHSRYRDDPLSRVLHTANFIGATTYGSKSSAQAAIRRVRAIHERVRGVAPSGETYHASDPHLLAWIHSAGVAMFLASYRAFGAVTITDADADAYVLGAGRVARDLGAISPPTNVAELNASLLAFRPELRLTDEAVTARDFIARGVVRGFHQRAAYQLVVAASYSLLEPWAREMLAVPRRRVLNPLAVRPATKVLDAAVRLAVPPVTPARWRATDLRRRPRPDR